jgi:TIR domain
MRVGTGAIFVSDRRAETRDIAGRLADRLMHRFGDDQVFVDVEDIEPGVDFVAEIERAVTRCRVLVVVIGPTWHTVTGTGRRPRLHDPHDAVAIEVRTALAAGILVVPVLVDGAGMPHADEHLGLRFSYKTVATDRRAGIADIYVFPPTSP